MCTAVKYGSFFGRTLDFEHSFGERAVKIQRGQSLSLKNGGELEFLFSAMGTAVLEGDFPLFFDGMNEAGLCAAALNFPKYAVYRKPSVGRLNLASFELIPYILARFSSVEEMRWGLRSLSVTDTPYSPSRLPTPLHWIVCDKEECAVIEPLFEGVRITDNRAGVLTNSPPLDYHLTRLADFAPLSPKAGEEELFSSVFSSPYSRGLLAVGLPGDWSSFSRFARAVFVKNHIICREEGEALEKILSAVCVPPGCAENEQGEPIKTIYTCLMDMSGGIYSRISCGGERSRLEFS